MTNEINNHSSEPLPQEPIIAQRVEQLKDFSRELQAMVYEELALVQDDVVRVRNIVSDSIHILQTKVESIGDTARNSMGVLEQLHSQANPGEQEKLQKVAIVNTLMNKVDESLEETQQQLQSDSMDVMRALQFEDIVSQVTERVAQQIGDIRTTVNTLSRLYDSEFSSTFDQDLVKMREELLGIRKKLAASSTKEIVGQQNMDEGDIELF